MSEKEFFNELLSNGHVWVIMKDQKVLSLNDTNGNLDLPVWYCKEIAIEFLSNISALDSYNPVEIPLEIFKVSWLAEGKMNFNELIINPNGINSKNLALTKKEFINRLWH